MNDASGLSRAELDLMRSVEDRHWWYHALRGHVLNSIDPARADFELLDAGCGSGGMLARLHEKFPRAQLTGLDLSEHALQLTAARLTSPKLIAGSVDRLPFPEAAFDYVISLDVIYHRDVDEAAALVEMHRVLRPGGKILLNLPAFDFLRGSHDLAINTARRYNRLRLAVLLEKCGFRIECMTYWNMTLLPALTLVRWASRRRPHDAELRSDLAPPSSLTNAIFGTLTRAELAISRHFPLPFGTSLFAIATK